jgi:mannose-6-phosphate isomerase-like protein (cupin superfamily)
MVEKKWEKNIIYQTPPHPLHPKDAAPSYELYHLNDNIVKCGFCFTSAWVLEPNPRRVGPWEAHYHDSPEYLIFMGGNSEDPRNLGAEVELWIEDEKYIITKSCAVFIPTGVRHTPVIMHRVDRPFIFISTLPEPTLGEHHVAAPKSFVAPWND